jgi:hypothetical protein
MRSSGSASQRPETALRGAVALSCSPPPAEAGSRAGSALGGLVPGVQFDLIATGPGLVIGRSADPELAVPTLIPWALVGCALTGAAEGPDGPGAAVLTLWAADQQRQDGPQAVRAARPARGQPARGARVPPGTQVWRLGGLSGDLTPFLSAVAAGRAASAPEPRRRQPAHASPASFAGVVVGLQASAARLLRSLHTGEADPQHGQGRRRVAPIAVGLMALVLLAGSTSASFVSAAGAGRRGHASGANGQVTGNRTQAAAVHLAPALPAATSTPAPAPPSLAGSAPLQPHEIFGYAPYWTLPESSGFEVADLTTLAYFSVDANGDGTLDESGPGWNGYESQDLVSLVDRAHAAGDRVVLTVTDFSQGSLDAITSDPNAAARLSSALITAVAAKNLDGVNFDFEGQGSADRNGLTNLITQVSRALHAANPHWQVTMATYASAAGDSTGFYDVAALAPAVDGFFVMAYDMNDRTTPSATAPLTGGGFNDTEALQQFTAVAPASKIILGVPFYGYDWPTTDGTVTAQATGGETPLSDAVIAASGHPTYWDPSTDSAWTSYQVGQQWHETYFDDPTSLAMKAQLAASFHIAGLGIWALGMDGNDPSMLAALLGNAPPVKDYTTGPTTTSAPASSSTTTTTGPAGSGFTTTGVWNTATVPLHAVAPPASDGNAVYLGTVVHLATDDPALACLQSGPPLKVWSFSTLPGVDVVVASQPEDCATAMWTFSPPPTTNTGSGGAPPTITAPSSTTTTTTIVPPPTSSTTTSPPATTDPATTDPDVQSTTGP